MPINLAGDDLDNFIYDLQQKQRNLIPFIDKTINDNQKWITGKIKLRFWNQGKDGFGKPLANRESSAKAKEKYKKWKASKGMRSRPTNLHVTKEFWNTMFAESKNGIVNIDTDPSRSSYEHAQKKDDTIFRRFGENILTLTPEEQKDVIEFLEFKIAEDFNKAFK